MVYVLGHRPDEFGLVPDEGGFVSIKELLQALHEEEGWGYVRRSHMNEVLVGVDRNLFETADERIRSRERRWDMDLHEPVRFLPKVLFTPVRQRAHPVVMEKGLRPPLDRHLVLTPNREMALRIGRRRDQDPVLLEIMAETAGEKGILFFSFGDLFLATAIPARFIAGPPLPKEVIERRRERAKEKEAPAPTPGTFVLDPSRDPDPHRRARGKKRKGWKEAAKRMRKGRKGRP
ncbi:MAG: RNA 2'-phosphotransferase [Deltaproteobacteria bacterium]|nr:RNA 2'-phosphotransferase [Deltaproteobacteria bacterium]